MAFRRFAKRGLVFVLVLGGLWAFWEGYKWLWERTGWSRPFRVDDLTLPHVHTILLQLGEPTSTGDDLWLFLLRAALFTAKSAAVGFAFGAIVGFLLGVVLVQFDVLRRGVMPYVVASQTIPILALAPIVVRGLGSVSIGGEPPPDWVRVSVIASYLTFFPVTMNTIRGLRSADPRALELMHSYAARGWTVLWKLRVPSALPYIFTALKIAATASVVGAIIGEQTASISDGLGGAILNFNQYYVLAPASLWATNLYAALLGIGFFLVVLAAEKGVVTPCAGAARMSADPPVVSIEDISKVFGKGGVAALEGIGLDVERGEFVSLIGPSGCGKSTLLRIVGDIIEPSSGKVTVNGKPARRARLDRDYGIVFQAPVLYDWRTVVKNIALPLEMLGWDRAKRAARVREMVELVELSGFEKHHPWQLSGGMQQRVSIARALSFSPALLLMDEPFGALDEMTRERLNLELLRIWTETGSTVIFVTHSISEAVFLSTRVVVMSPRPGRVASIVPVDLPQPRTAGSREQPRFFELVTQVRESLHAVGADEVEETLSAAEESA
jgi:NitT/TauT family transport system ATP-binding protein